MEVEHQSLKMEEKTLNQSLKMDPNQMEEVKVKEEVKLDPDQMGEEQKSLKMEEETLNQLDREEDEEEDVAAAASGDPIGISGKGIRYKSFHYDGKNFEFEDVVLQAPEDVTKRTFVALIKDIYAKKDGHLMITAQQFYQPEEAENKTEGNWELTDKRGLLYSLHGEDAPA